MSFYRKLRDYILEEENTITVIFGSLISRDCQFCYEKDGEYEEWTCSGIYSGEKDFLLDYYVTRIFPSYRIDDNRIIPYLRIILSEVVL